MIRTRAAVLLFASFAPHIALAGAVHAQTDEAQAEGAEVEGDPSAPVEQTSVLSVRWAGIAAQLTSPKDRGLLQALRMLDDRIAELPAELGKEQEVPPDVLPLLALFFEGRAALDVGFAEPGPVPFFLRLELAGADASQAPAALFESLLASTGLELGPPDAQGRVAIPLDLPMWYRDDAGVLVVGLGAESDAALEPIAELPAGVADATRVRLDYAALFDEGLPMLESLGADVGSLRPGLDATGMSSVTIETATGSDETRCYTTTISRGWGDTAVAEILADEPIPASALELVPADAEWAVVGAYDLMELAEFYRDLFETLEGVAPDDGEYREEAQPLLAILDDLQANFLPHVGHVQGMYASDTTGGGGLFSTVLFASLTDAAAFSAALDERLASLEELGRNQARGYVRLQREDMEGGRITSLVFAGLPVPFEPSYAIAGGNLFVGPSAQSVRSAVEQASRGAAGLSANPRFAAQMGALPADLNALAFFDAPRFLRDGYSLAARVSTSLANAVRSPSDLTREPGAILPPFAELADGALAMVMTSRLRGSDLVVNVRADTSKLVNATAFVGCFGSAYGLIALGAFGAAVEQREAQAAEGDSDQAIAWAEIAMLHSALDAYALEHGGAYPSTLEELATPDASGNVYLEGELGLDPWGHAYQYKAPKREGREPRVFSFGADGKRGGLDDVSADTELAEPEPKTGFEALLESLFE